MKENAKKMKSNENEQQKDEKKAKGNEIMPNRQKWEDTNAK